MESFFAGTTAQARDYQERLCRKTLSMLEGEWRSRDGRLLEAAKSVLIEAPTGAGKTVMALALAQWGADRGNRIGWVSMRRNLLWQAEQMRDEFGFRVPNMRFISMFEQNPPTDVDWLIVDEAQHDSTSSMAHIHAMVRPKKVIGLSATPYRTDRAQLAFERVVRDVGIHTLIQEKWLSEYDHYTIPKYSPQAIADLFRADRERWGKSVVFFLTKEECDAASDLLRRAGVKNEVVWGGSDREAQIDAFREGKVQVLVSMSILSEGFDADDMKTVFIRPSSRLPAVQMGGRVLRKHPDIPVKQMVQCQVTKHPFVKTARARTSYVQVGDEFRTLTRNENIDKVIRHYAKQVLHAQSALPDFVLKSREGRRKSRRR
jgi:superfamily II DNA or RNA helicase